MPVQRKVLDLKQKIRLKPSILRTKRRSWTQWWVPQQMTIIEMTSWDSIALLEVQQCIEGSPLHLTCNLRSKVPQMQSKSAAIASVLRCSSHRWRMSLRRVNRRWGRQRLSFNTIAPSRGVRDQARMPRIIEQSLSFKDRRSIKINKSWTRHQETSWLPRPGTDVKFSSLTPNTARRELRYRRVFVLWPKVMILALLSLRKWSQIHSKQPPISPKTSLCLTQLAT